MPKNKSDQKNESKNLKNNSDIEKVKETLADEFLDKMKDDEKLLKDIDTQEKEKQFEKDMKSLKKDSVKNKDATPPGRGQVKTKTGTVMSLVTKPEAVVTTNTTVQLKVTGVKSGVTQVVSVILTP